MCVFYSYLCNSELIVCKLISILFLKGTHFLISFVSLCPCISDLFYAKRLLNHNYAIIPSFCSCPIFHVPITYLAVMVQGRTLPD